MVGNLNILSQTVNWKSLRRPRCNSRSSSLNWGEPQITRELLKICDCLGWLKTKQNKYHLGNCDKVSKSEKAEEPQTANLFKNPQPASALPTHHHNHCKFLSKFIEMYPNFLKSEISHTQRVIFWVKALLDHILGKQRQNFWETSVSKKCLFSWICWPLLRTNWIMPPRVQSLRRKTIC